MAVFREWLLITEGRNDLVAPGVLQGYEAAFREELRKVVARTREPRLRAVLADMLDCPVRDARGHCRSFTDLIIGTLLRNGLHRRYDLEACVSYVVEKMLMDTTERGEPRSGLFAGFEERPDYVGGNPLTARFLKFLEYAVATSARAASPAWPMSDDAPPAPCPSAGVAQRKATSNQASAPTRSRPRRQRRATWARWSAT